MPKCCLRNIALPQAASNVTLQADSEVHCRLYLAYSAAKQISNQHIPVCRMSAGHLLLVGDGSEHVYVAKGRALSAVCIRTSLPIVSMATIPIHKQADTHLENTSHQRPPSMSR